MLMEFKFTVYDAMQKGKQRIKDVFSDLALVTGRDYGGLIEAYHTRDAEVVLIGMGSMAGTIKEAVDELCSEGKKVGFVKIRCYRPFPYEDIWEEIKNAQVVGVMEADVSMGSEGAVSMDLKAKVCGRANAPLVLDFIAGLGGREINMDLVREIVGEAEKVCKSGVPFQEPYWAGLNPSILP